MAGVTQQLPITEIIGIAVCLVGSAFFSGVETALTHLPETRARQLLESDPGKYAILQFWLDTKKRILAALLVGNNLTNILCSILTYRVSLMFLPDYAEAISVFALTLVILITAEITPKSIALHYSEGIAPVALRIVWIIDKLFWVVTKPLSLIPDLIVRKDGALVSSPPVTEDEIEYQIRLGHDQSVFEEAAQGDLLMSALDFSETTVKEVMIPRTDMVGLDVNTPPRDAIQAVIASGHSRIPVYQENLDRTIGLLHAKDILALYSDDASAGDIPSIESLIRSPVLFAPETQKISVLLAKMKTRGRHLAIVVDEFGGTAGLITLEDIIEELVGEIRDEFDPLEAPVRRIDSTTWIVDARLSISDLKDETGIELPDSGDYESVGGFVTSEFGNIPVAGTVVMAKGVRAKVLLSDARHIERLELKILTEETDSKNG